LQNKLHSLKDQNIALLLEKGKRENNFWMKKSPPETGRTAALRCSALLSGGRSGFPARRKEAESSAACAGGGRFKPCALSPGGDACDVIPGQDYIPIINTKFLYSRLAFPAFPGYITRNGQQGLY